MNSFNELGLAKPVVRGVIAAGYENPSPIQLAAIPIALQGEDLIGSAQTGTGKTAAFVLPILNRLLLRKSRNNRKTVRSLIVVPTRELALQVDGAIRKYAVHTGIKSLAVFGGAGIHLQLKKLRQGVDIVVATPGRLLDHMARRSLHLSAIEILVLDEADRMLDMGFIPDIRKIVAATPDTRQTMFFSATMPPAIRSLADSILTQPQLIEVGKRRNPAETVNQRVCSVLQKNKMALLTHLLKTEPVQNVIVFTRTKHRADRIAQKLSKKGFLTAVLHSNRSQSQREYALNRFKRGKCQILVATNIAARGIDVHNVSHVINFDTPQQPDEYIHRIGRTGRAEAKGDAITFVGEGEIAYQRDIERHIGKRLKRLECEELTEMKGHPITMEPTRSKPVRKRNLTKKKRGNGKFSQGRMRKSSQRKRKRLDVAG